MPHDERTPRLLDEGGAQEGHGAWHVGQVRHQSEAEERAKEARQRVRRVVAEELGVLEGSQVVDLAKDGDARVERLDAGGRRIPRIEPRDEDAVELLDEEGPGQLRRHRGESERVDLGRVGHDTAHLADDRVSEPDPRPQEVALARLQRLRDHALEHRGALRWFSAQ